MTASDSLFAGAPILSAFTRADALGDGTLIDLTTGDLADVARPHIGNVTPLPPLAITATLRGRLADAAAHPGHDLKGCLHDVLSVAGVTGGGGFSGGLGKVFMACLRQRAEKTWRFPVTLAGQTDTLVASVHQGDVGEPVITIMCEEDA